MGILSLLFVGANPKRFIEATGGTVITDGDYKVHIFTGSDTFTVTQTGSPGNNSIEYLLVAGGGGGGGTNYNFVALSAGAGAGGALTGNFAPAVQSYAAIIGAGGPGTTNGGSAGTNGNNTTFNGLTAIGGGRGGSGPLVRAAVGGSGGGETVGNNGAAGTPGQGYAGGDSVAYDPMIEVNAAGGGGATSVGANGINGAGDIAGGTGLTTAISGAATTYSTGGVGNKFSLPIDGAANSGDGGSGFNITGGTGGSGIVILRYKFQ